MLTLSPSLMASIDDWHLLAALETEPALMRTPVELELMRRLERQADKLSAAQGFLDLAEEYEFTADELLPVLEELPGDLHCYAKMLAALNDADIERPEQLETIINFWKDAQK